MHEDTLSRETELTECIFLRKAHEGVLSISEPKDIISKLRKLCNHHSIVTPGEHKTKGLIIRKTSSCPEVQLSISRPLCRLYRMRCSCGFPHFSSTSIAIVLVPSTPSYIDLELS
jgi:hypothetical protein